jgi:hypothetical protein
MSLYVKNVPSWERLLRILIAAVAVVVALFALEGIARPLVAASAVGLALSGLLGFCPACGMLGRKLDRSP